MRPIAMKPVSSHGCAGFSLVEGIAGLMIFSLMMGALTYGMASLFKFQAQPQVTYNRATYALAPSFANFHEAVNLHERFAQAIDQADNVVVLGGVRSNPAVDPNGPSSTLAETFSATTLSAAAGSDPFQGLSSWDQRQINSSQFSSALTSNADSADFTILTVQGQSRVTSITQQRRYTATINGQNLVLYEDTHQAIDWSSGSPVFVPDPDTGSPPTSSYRIYYAANEDNWLQRPGATHYWYRTDSVWDRDQEGPSRIVFADPYVLSGHDERAQVTAVSRFVYFLPQVR
jgi:hypothetical protein